MSDELQSTFELTGSFWRPEDAEARVSGILRYSAGRIALELLGSFGDRLDDITDTSTILGLTSGGPCTLQRAMRTLGRLTIFSDSDDPYPHSVWSARRLLLGAEFPTLEDARFSTVRFRFEQLERWLAHNPFETETSQGRFDLRSNPFEPMRIELPGLGAALTLGANVSRGGDVFRMVRWSQDAYLEIDAQDLQSLDWFMERLDELRALLGLLVGEPVAPTTIVGVTASDNARPVSVFFKVNGDPAEQELHPAQMLLPYSRLGARFTEVAQDWFRRQKELKTVVALLFGTLYVPSLPLEFRFLALTQALETFHRHTRLGRYLTEEEYAPIASALIDALPNGMPSDLRQSLIARIGYGNEASQRKRFRELLESLGDDARAVVTSDASYVDRIVDMRNHLTHYPAAATPPMTRSQLFYETVRLRALLTLLLLSEVGIQGAEAAEAVRRTRWQRGYLGT